MLNISYLGQYYDAESGLSQNWWRSYDPRMGRYTQNDPIGLEGGMNRFNYFNGDGVNGFDPRGLQAAVTIPAAVIGGGIIAYWWLTHPIKPLDIFGPIFSKPLADACDANGAKAPGKPGPEEGFSDPKSGPNWVPNPNGSGNGWQGADGNVWVPTGPGGGVNGGEH